MTIRELITKILFRSDATGLKKVETNTAAAKRQMRAASRAAYALKRDLRGIAIGVKTMVAAVVAGRIAKVFTADFAKSTDEAIKFSKAIGISLESYMGLTHAVRLSGGDLQDMNKALTQLQKRALEATQGLKEPTRAFGDIGIKVKDSNDNLKNAEQLLLEVADAFKYQVPESERAGRAMQMFGRTGAKLIPMFMAGKKGIREMMIEAKRLGIVLSKDQAKIAEEYNDEMLRAKSVLVGLRNVISLRVLPAITKNIRAFQLWAREGDNLRRMIDGLIVAAKALAVVFALVAAVKFGQTMGTIALATKRAALWTRTLGAAQAIAYAKFILVAMAIAAVALVIQDLYVYAKGGESAVGRLLERFAPADKIRKVLNAIGSALKTVAQTAAQLGRDAIPVVVAALQKLIPIGVKLARAWWAIQMAIAQVAKVLWREFGPALQDLGAALVELFDELWPVVVDGARDAWRAMQSLGSELLSLWRAIWPELKSLASAVYDLMEAGADALREAWKELRPAVEAIGEALSDLWVVAKPALAKTLEGTYAILRLLAELAKSALPHLAKQFKTVFQGIALVITGAIKQLTAMVKLVTTVIRGIKSAYNGMLELLGLQGKTDLGAALKKAGVAPVTGAAPGGLLSGTPAPAGTQQNNTLTVGTMALTVQGTTGMSPAELEAATKKALQGAIADTFSSFAPVTP